MLNDPEIPLYYRMNDSSHVNEYVKLDKYTDDTEECDFHEDDEFAFEQSKNKKEFVSYNTDLIHMDYDTEESDEEKNVDDFGNII